MKIRHYALAALAVAAVVFLQPLVVLFGNLMLLGGVLAYIYRDLPPPQQDAWDRRIALWMQAARSALKRPPALADATPAKLEKKSGLRMRFVRRKAPLADRPD
ncbi:MAG: hypothetical protein M3Z21_07705 [Pseudomonadota bacterium]|nr:hypothetical protein [Pseudomonadota bacterium]